MSDNPTRTPPDVPPPPPPPARHEPSRDGSLRPTPEFQQKLDDFRAAKEAGQDAGTRPDHREKLAENQALSAERKAADNQAKSAEQPRPREQARPTLDGDPPRAQRPENRGETPAEARNPRTAPHEQRLNGMREQRQAKQDAGQPTDHTPKTATGGDRNGNGGNGDKPPAPPGTAGPGSGPGGPRGPGDGPNGPGGPGHGPSGPNGPRGPGDGPNGPGGKSEGSAQDAPKPYSWSAANADAKQQRLEKAVGLPPERNSAAKSTPAEGGTSNNDAIKSAAANDREQQGPLTREDPALHPAAHAAGIGALRGAAMASENTKYEPLGHAAKAAANVWEAKVTAEPGSADGAVARHVGFDAAADAGKKAFDKVTGGQTGPDLNIDGTTDKLRDRLDAYQDSKQPARDDDGQGPLFR